MGKKISLFLLLSFMAFFFTGCAHKIEIGGVVPKGEFKYESSKNTGRVAYLIDHGKMNQEFITSCGGGDRVSYFPYKNIDYMIKEALKSSFENVYLAQNQVDIDSQTSLVFVPFIQTRSSSSSIMFWPPEMFSIVLNVKAYQKDKVVWETTVAGNGTATFDEFKTGDFGLAGRRAAQDVIVKFQHELSKAGLHLQNVSSTMDTSSVNQSQWR